ncbi:MAG: tyrosine--tRNA ligase [Planctomycetes bacterium]|nr:tyrosine--tRNA ligase [Planctomycetota bacterium]
MNVFTELQWRGLVHQATADNLQAVLESDKLPMYIGFDPTATSLHAGSLIPLMCLRHFRRAGHPVIVLIGGATGLIGDPSGKSEERVLETIDTVRARGNAMRAQIERFLSPSASEDQLDGPPPKFVNNIDWLGEVKLLDFLRDIGKHFSVNEMVHKDSVKKRFGAFLPSPAGRGAGGEGSGISYTEFTYMLLQATDFLELFRRHGCRVQCGASDQWGNICEGIALIRRIDRGEAYGLTMPLLTNSEGKKMGKSEKGAIWLDPKQTSPYAFYQFWVNMADADAGRFLRWFTFLDEPTIRELETKIGSGERIAQKTLAQEITTLVHGKQEMETAKKASEALFSGDIASLPVSLLKQMAGDVPSITLTPQELGSTMPLVDRLVKCGACSSKADARRNLSQKGIRLNGKQPAGENPTVSAADFLDGEVLVVQRGKRKSFLFILTGA